MPTRKNLFGETIIQPNTGYSEIDSLALDKGVVGAEPSIATIFTEFDSNFKIGGEIILFGNNIEAEEGEDDPIEVSFQFDNFGTVASARAWLEEIGFTQIEEVN